MTFAAILLLLTQAFYPQMYPFPGPKNAGSGGGGSPYSPTTKTCTATGGSSVTTLTCTWSVKPASGELMVCNIAGFTTGLTYTATDDNSDSFSHGTLQSWSITGGTSYAQNFYFRAVTSINTVTANFSSASAFPYVICDSATGGSVSPFDAEGHASGAPGVGGTITASFTTAGAADYVFCAGNADGASVLSVGSGFTAGANPTVNILGQYEVASSTSISAGMTTSHADPFGELCTAFQ